MSDFLDFYKREEQKRSMTEEQQLELHKKQKALQAKRFAVEDDDDFYNESIDKQDEEFDEYDDEDIRINEGVRIPYRPNRSRPARTDEPEPSPISTPQPLPEPEPAPTPRPRPRRTIPTTVPTEPDEEIYTPPQVRRRELKLSESSNNPALNRAYTMMNEMQQKIETAFYRYGMSGLEKINKHLDKIFEAIVNPKPKEIVKYVEKPVKVIEKPVYMTPSPVKESLATDIDEPNEKEPVELPETDIMPNDEQASLKEQFIKMNETADSDLLSNALLLQGEEQSKTVNDKLAQIEANAQLLREKIGVATEAKTKTLQPQPEQLVENDEITPSESLEIVDDPVVDAPVEIVKPPVKSTKSSTKKRTKKTK